MAGDYRVPRAMLSRGVAAAMPECDPPPREMTMSSVPPTAPEPSRKRLAARFGLPLRALLLIALAFGIGLLLFLLLWLDQRDDADFFRAGPLPTGEQGEAFKPLPMPDAAGDRAAAPAAGADTIETPSATRGEIVEEPPLATDLPPAEPPSAPAAPVVADASARPIRSPQPRYPERALRRGESGTVLLQVHVDESGRPHRVDVVQSSRSRTLDREATRAVERWQFSPAIRNGRAVPAKVLVPIEFHP